MGHLDAARIAPMRFTKGRLRAIISRIMPRKLSRPRDDPEQQSKRFIETARELGCDEDEAAFDEKLKRIATAKPNRPERSHSRRTGPKKPAAC
jgi:hypothetical protein